MSGPGPTSAELVRHAAALGRAVTTLHALGIVHGAIHPGNVAIGADGEAVLLGAERPFRPDPADPTQAPLLAFAAPELLRGGKPSKHSDVFALAATIHALATGESPFAAPDPLEAIRRVLYEKPVPLASVRPGLPAGLDAVLSRALAKSAWRRASARRIAEVAETMEEAATATPTSTSTSTAARSRPVLPERRADAPASARSRGTRALLLAAFPAIRGAGATLLSPLARAASTLPPLLANAVGRIRRVVLPSRPHARAAALAAVGVFGLALLAFPDRELHLARREASLAARIAAHLERGALAEARAALDEAARERPRDPLVEKLRGDVACARGAPGECLRRYRVALAARPELRQDEALRVNARRLLAGRTCSDRRAAAELLGELRDPGAIPALEHARRTAGPFAFLCTRGAIERAIEATRTSAGVAHASARRASRFESRARP